MTFQMDSAQLELMQTILHNDGEIVLANNERIVVPDTLRFIWEVRLYFLLTLTLILLFPHISLLTFVLTDGDSEQLESRSSCECRRSCDGSQ